MVLRCIDASKACVNGPQAGAVEVQSCIRHLPLGAFWKVGIISNIKKNDKTCRGVIGAGMRNRAWAPHSAMLLPRQVFCYLVRSRRQDPGLPHPHRTPHLLSPQDDDV